MKRLSGLFGLGMLLAGGVAQAATCTSIQTGNWNSATTWSCNKTPGAGDTVIINSPYTVNLNGSNRSAASLTVNAGATLVDDGQDLTVSGNVLINGTYDGSGNNGNLIMTGGAGTTLSGTGTFIDIKRIQIDGNVTIPAGSNFTLTLDSEIRVNGTLNLNGTISGAGQNPGNRILQVDNAPATLNIGSTGQINAPNSVAEVKSGGTVNNSGSVTLDTLQVNVGGTWNNTGGSCNVPNQSPAGVCVSGVTVTITASSPNPSTPGASVTWAVSFSQPVTGVTASNFALVPGGGVAGSSITSVTGTGAAWTVTANTGSGFGTLGLNMVNATGIAPAVTSTLPVAGTVYTIEAPMSCLTDNFASGVLDSTLWSVARISGTFTPGIFSAGAGDNRLRLTDTGAIEATFATLKRTFPGAGNKIVLEIDYFAYGGSGADGIAVTFSDSAITSTTGGFGGSLGYAQRTGISGFGGGWLGIGLDEYGNYPNSTEGRPGYPGGWVAPAPANVAAGFYKTNVSVRGSGSGMTGYNLLANTGTLATAVNPPSGAAGATPYRYRFTIDHSNGVNAWVTVERDTTAPLGDAYAVLVPTFDVKASAAQAPVPVSWSLSFTGSTGGANNNHEFKRVSVCANTIAGGGPHHFEIQHADGQGVTCSPSTLTIKACADNAVPCTPYTAGVSGTLSAAGTPTVNWGGGSNAFAIAAGSSTVSKNIQVTTVGSVTLDATSTPAPSAATTCSWGSCTFTAADSALLVSAPDHLAESVSTLTIQAVKAAPGNPLVCVPGMTGTKTVNLKCSYTNPVSGTQAVRVGGAALNATNNPASVCDAGGANVSMTFDASGIATPSLQYADVGQMTLSATYTGTPGGMDAGLVMTGSGSFIAAPALFSVTGVSAGPIKAGNTFSATVTALNAAGNATPNFGKESAAEGANLSSVLAMGAGTWANPALGGTTVIPGTSFVNGAATVSDLTWAEVGVINLDAALTSANYLGSGLATASGLAATSTTFIPEHYTTVIVSAGGAPMSCPDASCPANTLGASGMVYSGQPFTVKVTAKNLTGATTTNYQGAYAQDVTLSGVGGSGTISNPPLKAVNFNAGVGITPASALPSWSLGGTPAAPANITLHAAGYGGTVQSSGAGESGVKVAQGRLKLANVYGSEQLPLTSSVTAQYCASVTAGVCGWVASTTDSSSQFNTSSNLVKTIVSGSLTLTDVTVTGAGAATLNGGRLNFMLNRPGKNGVVDLCLNAPTYLSCANGRVTFGVYKGRNEFIYRREAY